MSNDSATFTTITRPPRSTLEGVDKARRGRARVALAIITSLVAYFIVALGSSAQAATVCENGFEELAFDYSQSTNIIGNGTNQGDAVLFENVATRLCGGLPTSIDALVTTSVLSSAAVVHYEVNTASAGPDTSADTTTNFFEVDINADRSGGYADFTFAFYRHGTYQTTPEPVTLQNVKATAIDIDNKAYGILSGLDSFTLASDTRLSNDYAGGGFPATVKFTGASSNGTNDIRDRVTASYSAVQTFTYRVGVGDKDSNGQTLYFGVTFQDLGWNGSNTTGNSYTLSYDANGGTGTTPTSVTAVVGSSITLSSNSGADPLVRTGYTFAGWNTQADGNGTNYAAGASIFMPGANSTLYAKWTPVEYTLSYDLNGADGTPPTAQTVTYNSTTTVTSTTPTRTGYTFTSWNTAANGSGTSYASGATTSPITNNVTLYAIWSMDEVTTTTSTTSTSTTLPPATTVPPAAPPPALVYWTVSFDANGGNIGSLPPSTPVWDTGLYTIPGNTGSLGKSDGSTFLGWNTAANGSGILYSSGSKMAVTSNVVLYATWSPVAAPTTSTLPELQVIIPTNPTPEDLFITFPDQLPKTGADLTNEVIAALLLGLTTLGLVFSRQIRSLVTLSRRTVRRNQ